MEALHLNERERLVIHEGGIILGREQEREKAMAKTRQMVKDMLNDGMEVPLIAKYSGLSTEEINALK